MLDHDDLKWVATNATELNRLMQQVTRLSEQARQHKGEGNYLDLLNEQAQQACKTSQALFDRITSRILYRAGSEMQTAEPSPSLPGTAAPSARTNVSERIPLGEMKVETQSGDPPIRNPKGKRELVLVVDDDLDLLKVAADMLEFEDYRVILAKDGLEALQIYRRMGKQIGLIVLDYFLPVMDGDAVFDELKAIDPDVRVVLSSGFGEQAKLGSMLARGLCGFLPKPYTHEKLIGHIQSIIAA
ncbi:MAG TPA: response regulator [Chthoniobacterales bacterium]|nr:response regulator [Chthoniobacterales bacterium]